jgi:hypothetical protein
MLMSSLIIIAKTAQDGTPLQLDEAIKELGGTVDSTSDEGVIEATMPTNAISCLELFSNCAYIRCVHSYNQVHNYNQETKTE